eukprot:5783380-Pleurochrysis_carterae.AAC.1
MLMAMRTSQASRRSFKGGLRECTGYLKPFERLLLSSPCALACLPLSRPRGSRCTWRGADGRAPSSRRPSGPTGPAAPPARHCGQPTRAC